MFKGIKQHVAGVALALSVASLIFAAGAPAGHGQGAAEATRPLTPQERLGKSLYLRGSSPTGREITATVGEVEVPATTLTCAGCHGAKGLGKTEGGVTAGELTWAHLTKPSGHAHPSGRKHGPFGEAAFARAVADGIDPDGNELTAAMPRYRMSPEDTAALVAYLKRIASDRDPGLSDDRMRVGTSLPSAGPLAETGAAMKDVLVAYFDELNSRGGIHNRKIELRVADAGADAAAASANARRLIRDEQVFAMLGGITAGADAEMAALARDEEIPFVGPSTLWPQTGPPLNRYVFYLLPGVAEQARALVNFAAGRPEMSKSRVALVYPEGGIAATAAAAVEAQIRESGGPPPAKHAHARGNFDAAQVVRRLKQEGAGVVYFLGASGDDLKFINEAAAAEWTPNVFLLGVLTARNLPSGVPATFKGKVFLSFPSVPADITPAGLAEFRALQEKYKFAPRHAASQLAALAAAKVFVEGIKLAGRDVTRENLVTALEGLYNFETGLTPRLTFGPNRRVGASGAYVLTIDPEKGEYVPAGGWIKAD
jgi:ABC-type branched-subunit amino acid transport system substrate-binding protein